MNRDVQLKKYAKKFDYSYTLGAFPTIELLKNQPRHVLKVLLHPDMNSQSPAGADQRSVPGQRNSSGAGSQGGGEAAG